jgi:hypothetical protein
MTPREALTRYGLVWEGDSPGVDLVRDGEFYSVADVEARDQAREAEIRKLIAKGYVQHKPKCGQYSVTNGKCDCGLATRLESLLTPSPEGTKA